MAAVSLLMLLMICLSVRADSLGMKICEDRDCSQNCSYEFHMKSARDCQDICFSLLPSGTIYAVKLYDAEDCIDDDLITQYERGECYDYLDATTQILKSFYYYCMHESVQQLVEVDDGNTERQERITIIAFIALFVLLFGICGGFVAYKKRKNQNRGNGDVENEGKN